MAKMKDIKEHKILASYLLFVPTLLETLSIQEKLMTSLNSILL